jgi:hypothetical protein
MTTSRSRVGSITAGAALAAVLSFVALLAEAAPAQASPTTDAIAVLKSDPLYVAPDLRDIKVGSSERARAALQGTRVKVAVFKSGSGDPVALARSIGSGLSDNKVTVGVFVGTTYGAGSAVLGSGCAAAAIRQAVNATSADLRQTRDLTATIERFAQLASTAPTDRSCSGGSSGSGSSGSGSSGSGSSDNGTSGGSGWAILSVFGALGAGAIGLMVWRRRRRDRRALADARAEIQPYYDRLASEINTIQPGRDATARQAMSDASERFNSAGAQLATASSLAQLGGARRALLEGLQAARTARVALGLDPGPDLPPLAQSTAPQLDQPRRFDLNGQQIQGYPSYQPGAPYYFAGGGGYAGGWYSIPFWETLLIAEALSPGWGWGFGGWGFGGGYGAGYGGGFDQGFDQGFDEGRESVQPASDGGGDWGGGGDWAGGGGGDWGGGGGDWGGGGGDWGGGGGGGGDW